MLQEEDDGKMVANPAPKRARIPRKSMVDPASLEREKATDKKVTRAGVKKKGKATSKASILALNTDILLNSSLRSTKVHSTFPFQRGLVIFCSTHCYHVLLCLPFAYLAWTVVYLLTAECTIYDSQLMMVPSRRNEAR